MKRWKPLVVLGAVVIAAAVWLVPPVGAAPCVGAFLGVDVDGVGGTETPDDLKCAVDTPFGYQFTIEHEQEAAQAVVGFGLWVPAP